jgi:hypothetical protein
LKITRTLCRRHVLIQPGFQVLILVDTLTRRGTQVRDWCCPQGSRWDVRRRPRVPQASSRLLQHHIQTLSATDIEGADRECLFSWLRPPTPLFYYTRVNIHRKITCDLRFLTLTYDQLKLRHHSIPRSWISINVFTLITFKFNLPEKRNAKLSWYDRNIR